MREIFEGGTELGFELSLSLYFIYETVKFKRQRAHVNRVSICEIIIYSMVPTLEPKNLSTLSSILISFIALQLLFR